MTEKKKEDIVIKRVLITEKGSRMSTENRYVVQVDPKARKPEIAAAVEKKFGVHVLKVRTVTIKGVEKYIRGTRRTTTTPTVKKAYVTVREGERIEQV